VRRHSQTGKFYARITFNYVRRDIGPFLTAAEAKAVYDREARLCFGEYARSQ
jgi:hypothetical protein